MKFNANTQYPDAYTAWSTGFTAAVDICLAATARIPDTLEDALKFRPDPDNSDIDAQELNLWLNIGRHNTHGAWAICGARQATYMILLTLWDHTAIRRPETLPNLFKTIENSDPDFISGMIAQESEDNLDGIATFAYLDSTASRLFTEYL